MTEEEFQQLQQAEQQQQQQQGEQQQQQQGLDLGRDLLQGEFGELVATVLLQVGIRNNCGSIITTAELHFVAVACMTVPLHCGMWIAL
jgi:hypothetical protein